MRYQKTALVVLLVLAILGCTTSGPQKTLNDMAEAMEKNNPAQFMACIDMKAFAANYVNDITENDPTLNTLNNLGQLFGVGNLDKLLGSVVDFQNRLEQRFNRGVASGELMAECRTSDSPNCPWVPQSLREAKIVQINDTAAIAQVTTPARLTSWLALRLINNKWQVVGQAVMENVARRYAASTNAQPADPDAKATNI